MQLVLPTQEEIETARGLIEGIAIRTPLIPLFEGDAPIYLKVENLQRFGSFKIRAATNAIKSLPVESLQDGVVTASAGNFGQGLASAAAFLGVKCTVYVPETAAKTKIESMSALGAQIHVVPFEDWWRILSRRETNAKGVFIHPVADPTVIAGNGTIGSEILDDLPDVETVFLPVGGGGLASGVGAAIRAVNPKVKIFAAESEASMPVTAAFKAGEPVEVEHRPSFIDGMGGRSVLAEMWPLLQTVLDGAVEVSLPEVANAVRILFQKHHLIAEGAGAAPVAAALKQPKSTGKTVCVISGGNLDPAVLCEIVRGIGPGSSDTA